MRMHDATGRPSSNGMDRGCPPRRPGRCPSRPAVAQSDSREARQSFDRGAELENEAAVLLKQGSEDKAARRLREALAAYRGALTAAPADPDPAIRIGTILKFTKRCREALPILERTASLAFQVDLSRPSTLPARSIGTMPKLREMLSVAGQCRLDRRPDPVGFRLLELAGNLSTEVLFLLGRRYLEAGRHRSALKHLTAYVKQRPKDLKARRAVANLQLRLDQLSDAARSYRAILKEKPDDLNALKDLAVLEVRRSNYREAIKTFRRVLKQRPKDVQSHFNLGVCLARVDAHDQAISEFRTALKLNPKLARGWYKLGLSLQQLRRSRKAERAFETSLRYAPNHEPSYLALGRLHRGNRKPRQCASTLRRALRRKPNRPQVLIELGHCVRESGAKQTAVDTHLKAARLVPDDPAVHLALGTDYESLGQLDDAAASYRKALDLEKSKRSATLGALARVLSRLGTQALQQRKLDLAVTRLEESIALRPESAVDLANLGLIYLARSRPNKARELLQRAIRVDPNRPAIRLALGRLQLQHGEAGEALQTLSARSGLSSPMFDHLRGLAHLRLRQPIKASVSLRQAFQRRPNDVRIRFDLGRSLVLAQRFNEAWTVLEPIRSSDDIPTEALALIRGYAAYRVQEYEKAAVSLQKITAEDTPHVKALKKAALVRWGEAQAQQRQLRSALATFRKANDLGTDRAAIANAAAAEYQLGEAKKAYKTWRSLAKRRPPSEVYFNIAIYLDDQLGNEAAAYRWYRKYQRRLPPNKREQIAAIIARKQALFGFKP